MSEHAYVLPPNHVVIEHAPHADNNRLSDMAVIMVSGGFQYRVGAHRSHVQWARHLAAVGITTLRVDLSGTGDAQGELTPLNQPDNVLIQLRKILHDKGIQRVVFWGLCDGASRIIANADSLSPHAMILINPWLDDETAALESKAKHYYKDRLKSPEFWRKVLTLQFDWKSSVTEFSATLAKLKQAKSAQPSPFEKTLPAHESMQTVSECMRDSLVRLHTPMLVMISRSDATGEAFVCFAKKHKITSKNMTWQYLDNADHTLSKGQNDAIRISIQWLEQLI